MGEQGDKTAGRRMSRRTVLKLAGASGVGAVVASCFPGGTPGAPASAPNVIVAPETLTIGQGADAARLSPNAAPNLIHGLSIDSSAYENLVNFKRPPDYPELEPRLAERWELIKPDQWRFYLRPNVKFHNGADFDAESVVFTLEQALKNPGSGVGQIDKIVPVNKNTVDIFTKGPWFLLLYRLNSAMFIENRAWTTGPEGSPDKEMGTGPYKFVEWVKGDRVVMERNDNWWGGKLPYKRVIWRGIPETSTRVSALLAGEADIIRQIPAQDVARVNAKGDVEVRTTPSNRGAYMSMRQDGIYASKAFRQALNYALDKDGLIKGAMGGLGTRLKGQRNPRSLGADPNMDDFPYDVEKAKQLIKESGYAGQKVVIESSKGLTFQDAELSQAVGGYLEKAGLNVEVKILESGLYNTKFAGQAEVEGLYFSSSGNIIPDFENTLDDLVIRGGKERQWKDTRAVELRGKLQQAVDRNDRIKLALQGATLLHEEAPILFLAQQIDAYGVRKSVDWDPRPDEHIWVREVKFKG
jgi:peptide/nickel transport system substrate-binding protein